MKAATSAALIAAVLVAVSQAASANGRLVYVCDACRDVSEHPIDAANFALNATLGPDAFIFGARADEFDVVDLSGNRVTVDVNFSYRDGWFFPVFIRRFPIPVPIPDFNFGGWAILQAIVKDARGKVVLNLRIQAHKVNWPLKVGPVKEPLAPPVQPPPGPPRSGNGGGSEDDSPDGGDFEYEQPETEPSWRSGRVEIVDPDEYGDFGEWMEEL